MAARLLLGLLLCSVVSTAAGCCLASPEIRVLREQTQRRDAERFLQVAQRLAKQRGATPVVIRSRLVRRHFPFGVLVRARTPEGDERIHIAVRPGHNPGVLIARRGADQWLVVVATPISPPSILEQMSKSQHDPVYAQHGVAKALLRILATRGLDVMENQRTHILQCTDPDTLDSWLDRAVTVRQTDELFH